MLSQKGKKKTSEDVRRKLEKVLKEEEESIGHKLVQGVKVNHKLQDENSEAIINYEGEILEVSNNTITIQYSGYDSLFTWSPQELIEDIEQGDLTLLFSRLLCTCVFFDTMLCPLVCKLLYTSIFIKLPTYKE